MIHFNCDLCGKRLEAGDLDHHVLRIEIRPRRLGLELTEDDLDADHVQQIGEQLRAEEEDEDYVEEDETKPVHRRFDLCGKCRRRFLKNPFQAAGAPKFDFSEN